MPEKITSRWMSGEGTSPIAETQTLIQPTTLQWWTAEIEAFPVILASKCQTQQVCTIPGTTTTDGPTALCKNGEAENQLSNMDSSSNEYAPLTEGKPKWTKSNDMLSRRKKRHPLMLCVTTIFIRFSESKQKKKAIPLKIKQTVQSSLLCILPAPMCGLRILFAFLIFK